MIKLLKYSKPYLLMILFAVGLLFAQANLELALPDYLSDIVEQGSHKELLAKCGFYADLYNSQFEVADDSPEAGEMQACD